MEQVVRDIVSPLSKEYLLGPINTWSFIMLVRSLGFDNTWLSNR